MNNATVDNLLAEIETRWEQLAAQAIAAKISESPDEEYYAAGFWLLYCDYTVISPPPLAMNSEEHLAESPEDAEYHRWAPPEWKFDVLDETEQMRSSYAPLDGDHGVAVWERIIDLHQQALARVCRRLTRTARSRSGPFQGLAVSPKFVVGIFEERDGGEEFDRLARLSIEPAVLAELDFPLCNDDE